MISIECHLQIIGNHCANDLHSWSKEENSLHFEQTRLMDDGLDYNTVYSTFYVIMCGCTNSKFATFFFLLYEYTLEYSVRNTINMVSFIVTA